MVLVHPVEAKRNPKQHQILGCAVRQSSPLTRPLVSLFGLGHQTRSRWGFTGVQQCKMLKAHIIVCHGLDDVKHGLMHDRTLTKISFRKVRDVSLGIALRTESKLP